MRFVRVCIIVFMGLLSHVANADAYTYFQSFNGVPAAISLEHSETQSAACEAAEGLFYDSVTFPVIDAVTFNASTGTCYARLSSLTLVALTISSGAGSCAGDVTFNFEKQACLDVVDLEQIHGVLFAAFCFMCLIGGISTGYQLGS